VTDSTSSERRALFRKQVDRYHSHNLRVNLVEGSLFRFGVALLNAATVISAFLLSMGASKVVVGLVPSLFTFFWTMPQIISAYRLGHLPKKRRTLMIRRFISGLPWVAMAVVLAFYRGTPAWQNGAVVALIGTVIVFSLLGGYTVPLWVDFIGKIFRPGSRGSFYGWRAMLGATLGVAGSFALVFLLDPDRVTFPYGYAWTFAAAGACFSVGALFLGRSREAAPPKPLHDASKHGFIEELAATWRSSRAYRVFVTGAVVGTFGGAGMGGVMAWPFYMARAKEVLGGGGAYIGWATAVLILGEVIAALVGGRLVDRVGARIVYAASAILSCLTPLLGLAVNSLWLYLVVFLLMGFSRGLCAVSYHNVVLELMPMDLRARGIGLANFIRSPACLIASPIGGLILAGTGYTTLFVTAAIGGAASAVLLLLGLRGNQEDTHDSTWAA
jgi:predicted MFS family arabinose efflux permease/uncharacterized protein with PQ loop repeat